MIRHPYTPRPGRGDCFGTRYYGDSTRAVQGAGIQEGAPGDTGGCAALEARGKRASLRPEVGAAGEVHEDDAAIRLCEALAGEGVVFEPRPSEVKISLKPAYQGLLKVNEPAFLQYNLAPHMCCASRHSNSVVGASVSTATRVGSPRVPSGSDTTLLAPVDSIMTGWLAGEMRHREWWKMTSIV